MRNICITIQYDGSKYLGWQRLGGEDRTIQGKLEHCLGRMVGAKTLQINGAGRTDAGVHATGQVANFHINSDLSLTEIKDYLNGYLPMDICVLEISEQNSDFHARFNASKKIYEYRIWNKKEKNVFYRNFSYHVSMPLNRKAIQNAAEQFLGTHDFSAFCAYKGNKSKVRTIYSIDVKDEDGFLLLTYSGNGFLHKMVRIITGTLIEIGLGEAYDISGLLENKERCHVGVTAPAQGLCLKRVIYE